MAEGGTSRGISTLLPRGGGKNFNVFLNIAKGKLCALKVTLVTPRDHISFDILIRVVAHRTRKQGRTSRRNSKISTPVVGVSS
jgi:hypothetical protein